MDVRLFLNAGGKTSRENIKLASCPKALKEKTTYKRQRQTPKEKDRDKGRERGRLQKLKCLHTNTNEGGVREDCTMESTWQ